eukprot:gene29664-34749_t
MEGRAANPWERHNVAWRHWAAGAEGKAAAAAACSPRCSPTGGDENS